MYIGTYTSSNVVEKQFFIWMSDTVPRRRKPKNVCCENFPHENSAVKKLRKNRPLEARFNGRLLQIPVEAGCQFLDLGTAGVLEEQLKYLIGSVDELNQARGPF
jgi:hypothetical protein